ncbi:Transferase [Sesbania bispinosa]|nr:Transferase [Sesbania bispinosa]
MEIEIISTQFIKPSSPTPKHLKTHKLSLLDQFVPSIHTPVVLFYSDLDKNTQPKNNDTTQQRLNQLKESLSEILTHFYPFAGRIKDNLSIDCNDEGVHYVEAKSSYNLVEFLNQSNLSSFIHKLLPSQPTWEQEPNEGYVAMIQVTCFPCGGIVIGALVSHMVADGVGASFFLKSWGATSRREFPYEFPKFDSPFSDALSKDLNVMALSDQFLNNGRLDKRRFLFDAEAISKLKAKGSNSTVQNPTRVEVVSSLICKCASEAFRANSGLERPTLLTHAMNLRPRANPAFPESCMGNFVWTAFALMSKKELPELVVELREAVTGINSDFVKGFEGEGGYVRYNEVLTEMVEKASSVALTNGVNYVHCTSWCNFGLYDFDYGWGKPTWVSSTTISPEVDVVFFNSVLLMDTPSGNGIEAWIYLNEDDMTVMQQDKELLTFATLDPNPLQINSFVSKA